MFYHCDPVSDLEVNFKGHGLGKQILTVLVAKNKSGELRCHVTALTEFQRSTLNPQEYLKARFYLGPSLERGMEQKTFWAPFI